MDNFLMAQTAYVAAMQTVAQVDTVVTCAINHIILTQLRMKKGIKKFGEAGVRSIYKEMKQFHDRGVAKPLSPHEVTDEVKRKALAYLMFLKMKTSGEIKARGCANGRHGESTRQRKKLPLLRQLLNQYSSRAQWLQKRRGTSPPCIYQGYFYRRRQVTKHL